MNRLPFCVTVSLASANSSSSAAPHPAQRLRPHSGRGYCLFPRLGVAEHHLAPREASVTNRRTPT